MRVYNGRKLLCRKPSAHRESKLTDNLRDPVAEQLGAANHVFIVAIYLDKPSVRAVYQTFPFAPKRNLPVFAAPSVRPTTAISGRV